MNKSKIALTLALLPIFIHADGELAWQATKSMTQAAHIATPFIEYHNRMAVFGPFHQVYERIEPDAFYAGVETWFTPIFTNKDSNMFEAELRFGYNLFYNDRDHLTPFAGGGILRDDEHRHYGSRAPNGKKHRHHALLPAVGYGVIGILYDHEFNSVVNMGVNLKGIIGGGVDKKYFDWGNPVVGFDVAVPLTFRFGHKRHWDYRIEPFDIYLRGKNEHLNAFGLRNTIGYRF